ncbi:MAG TPA: efflux RND transporter periplasmic adaptor subunit [Vicinamibacteria bacterium]|nr:efflux RND transporter periplasmic adaptor subunit [Vicinamibacteria bacterium]
MDRPRTDAGKTKRRRIALYAAGAAILIVITIGLSRLEPAPPEVDRASVWIDAVKRGPMVRQVRGTGTLVPEEMRWVPAPAEGRVERIITLPGTEVKADTVLMVLSNPELELAAVDAESQAQSAQASYAEAMARLESARLDQQASAARVHAEYEQAKLRAEADAQLAKEGLVAGITAKLSDVTASELAGRDKLEKERLVRAAEMMKAQLAVQRALVEQRRAQARLRREQASALEIRAGLAGVVQQIAVEIGQRVAPGTNLSRVAAPGKLKAVIRVPETQAKDVQVGQSASVDTRNGIVSGKVARIDPAAQNGTVTVDISLEGELPAGARPDLTVDGTIELERLSDVIYVGRPAQAAEGQVTLFKLQADGSTAQRTKVRLGRSSVSTIEVLEGLEPGDRVILSDTSTYDGHDRLRLN